ncbi:hypothetical protein CTA1_5578 [Colletotrichum tanaceti]|uniref:Uncharacterized protein n=1 Tax=Colletotrichum tanaceti TaxID=1306861 RepID=A0A4U6X0G4_9PEZI|nr:hypothetical protein CTA1_5578 [Colletotrichum tanaceti]
MGWVFLCLHRFDRTDRFYDWDLQMSPVIVTGANPATIAHSSTYTVTDTIAVNGAFSPTQFPMLFPASLPSPASRPAPAVSATVTHTAAG